MALASSLSRAGFAFTGLSPTGIRKLIDFSDDEEGTVARHADRADWHDFFEAIIALLTVTSFCTALCGSQPNASRMS